VRLALAQLVLVQLALAQLVLVQQPQASVAAAERLAHSPQRQSHTGNQTPGQTLG